MKALNLSYLKDIYLNLNNDESIIEKTLKHITDSNTKVNKDEIYAISHFAEEMIKYGANYKELDGFFYSFQIPQISKQFDLLKISDKNVLNIEIKRETPGKDKIAKQLKQNRYYLSHLEKKIDLFAYISLTNKIYKLDENDNLVSAELNEIYELNKSFENLYLKDIESDFKPSIYLVSPLNDTKRFLSKEYFLSSNQENVKRDLLIRFKTHKCMSVVKGKAGTGKTLLMYDIAFELCKTSKVCVIHVGYTCDGHRMLCEQNTNLDVYEVKMYEKINYSDYDFLFVDESQRLYSSQLKYFFQLISQKIIMCVFFIDENQILNSSEAYANIYEKIIQSYGSPPLFLSQRIRTNPEIRHFVSMLYNKANKIDDNYNNIEIIYAENYSKGKKIIDFYRSNKGYQFINYTPSTYKVSKINKFPSEVNAHRVIGQEFKKIIIYMDSAFYYKDSILMALSAPNPDYLYRKMLFQALTRCREKLAIVVINNKELYSNLLDIVT